MLYDSQQETDYTGCYNEVSDSLKRGQHIQVNVQATSYKTDSIYAYVEHHELPYKGILGNYNNDTCSPIPKTEQRVIGIVDMAKWLVNHGYSQGGDGYWRDSSGRCCLPVWLFYYCGKVYKQNWSLYGSMIETVEVSK